MSHKSISVFLFCVLLGLISCDSPYFRQSGRYTPKYRTNEAFNYQQSILVDKAAINLTYAADIYSGYIPVDDQGTYIFYHLYPSNGGTNASATLNNTDPLILWMQGGPGCADWLGFFLENGPYTVVNTSTGTQIPVLTDINWNQGYNIMYVDQPPGTGFSPVGQNVSITNSMQAAEYMQTFLVSFFEIYSSLSQNKFYIFGESYAGHYIPSLASTLVANKATNNINLAGVAIGDGLVNPYYHALAWWQASFSVGIVDVQWRNEIQQMGLTAQSAFNQGNFSGVSDIFNNIMGMLTETSETGVSDIDDYRSDGDGSIPPYEFFVDEANFRSAYGIDPSVQYSDCAEEVGSDFNSDVGVSYAGNITYLLNNNLPVLAYNGQDDMCIPIAGTRGWIDNLSWVNSKLWIATPTQIFKVDGQVSGTKKSYKGLSFAVIYKAGHMVPMYQPGVAKAMIDAFIQNGSL
jgi:carboxypeptidase C (cathepsin A)